MSRPPIQFEDFRLDFDDAQLQRGNKRVALTPKAFDVLAHLAANAGRLVSKDELLNSLWEDALVSDASLVVCIREIRKALGDKARSPQFIETAHRRGYRFIADVREAGDAEIRQHTPLAGAPAGSEDPGRSAAAAPGSSTRRTSLIVGRDEEFAELAGAFQAALSGRRQTIFIAGAAGAGKTALINEFIAQHCGNTVRVTEGQCFEQFGEGEPYLPVLEALMQLTRQPGGERVVDTLARHAPTWLAQMPSLRSRLPTNHANVDGLGASATRMLREMAETLEALTADMPLILILEDLHWSDYSTVDLVSYISRRRLPARLMLIGTYRPVEIILSDHALKPVKRELQSKQACSEIPLTPISADAVAQYVCQRFPDLAVPKSVTAGIYQRTDGHALFVAELVSYLASRGKLIPGQGLTADVGNAPLPETIRAMIDTQINLVNEPQRQLLEAGSIAGVEFSAVAVAELLNLDVSSAEDQLDGLTERQQLLHAVHVDGLSGDPTSGDPLSGGPLSGGRAGREPPSARYRFRHVLYQEALYDRCPAARRARLHRRLAEFLEGQFPTPPPQLAAGLATHFERGHVLDAAIHYLRVAADRATRHYANREAAEYVSRALELTMRDQSLADERLPLLEQRGLIHRSRNDLVSASGDFEAMAREARRQGKVADQANAQFYLASVFSWVDREKCLDAARRANQFASQLNDELHRRHLRGWSAYWNLLWEGWTPDDAAASSSAIKAAREHNNRELLCLHLARSACFHLVLSDYGTACSAAEEAMRLATETGDASEFLVATLFRAWSCLYDGRWTEMSRLLWDGLQIAESNGHDRYAVLLRLQLAQLCNEAGDFNHAATLAERSRMESHELDLGYGQMVSPILLGVAYLGQGRADDALQSLRQIGQRLENERLLMDWIWKMPLRYATARCHLALGDLDAVRDFAAKLHEAASFPRGQTHEALSHQLLCDVALCEGNTKRAQKAIKPALEIVRNAQLPLAEWRVLQAAAAAFANQSVGRSQEFTEQSQAAFAKLVDGLDSTLPGLQASIRPIDTADKHTGT